MANTTNSTPVEEGFPPFFPSRPRLPTIPDDYEVTLYCLFFIIIILGNIWVIIAIVRQPKLRKSPTNWFIASLSVSDLMVAIFTIPYHVIYEYYPQFFNALNSDLFVCRTFAWMQWTSRCATVFSLLAIGIDRFRAIVQPLNPKINRPQAIFIIACVWIASFGYSSYKPIMFSLDSITHDNTNVTKYFCKIASKYTANGYLEKFFLADLLVMYLIPLLILISLYSAMIGTLWYRKSPSNSSNRNKKRATKMLFSVVILFAVTWVPYYYFTLYWRLTPRDKVPLSIFKTVYIQWYFAHTCYVSNSLMNPFLYAYFNENFRNELHRMFPCVQNCCKRNKVMPAGLQTYNDTHPATQPTAVS
ncbi:QRFP-like peptide receptor [Ptychodera flava]|uniref:QRFP-like peptide receptor n=1 Tax=Ptychodera flava TaxID=63121 RepID=UPI00396A088A